MEQILIENLYYGHQVNAYELEEKHILRPAPAAEPRAPAPDGTPLLALLPESLWSAAVETKVSYADRGPQPGKFEAVLCPLARGHDLYAYKIRSDCHWQSPFCRASPPTPCTPAARPGVAGSWSPPGPLTLRLGKESRTDPGRAQPLGLARGQAPRRRGWSTDWRAPHPGVNFSRVSVRVALALRSLGRSASLSQAAPSRTARAPRAPQPPGLATISRPWAPACEPGGWIQHESSAASRTARGEKGPDANGTRL
ncbi:uncharacterized protein LOC130683386 [Manis pentadactyla]|uniref:uncharacterized protein LOC130683386 n=1 Tax=Manis pentadactyla TaxID=143292 RepID=UPI00255C8184|nr:uncharacterized protein LOC130683386 [Manis pentadactyla]